MSARFYETQINNHLPFGANFFCNTGLKNKIFKQMLSKLTLVKHLTLLTRFIRILYWILNYLNGRTQRVLFKSFLSCILRVTSGVPQVSHLGPHLFTFSLTTFP